MCLCQMGGGWGGEETFSETHNENTTFELLLIHVTMSLINRGGKSSCLFIVFGGKLLEKRG